MSTGTRGSKADIRIGPTPLIFAAATRMVHAVLETSKPGVTRETAASDDAARDVHREATGIHDGIVSFTVEADLDNWHVLAGASGDRRTAFVAPKGREAGMPTELIEGYIEVAMDADAAGVVTFAVRLFGDEALVRGVV